MAFADTSQAIGAVTKLLVDQLQSRTQLGICVGRPVDIIQGNQLNLFLYQASFDPVMKNLSLDKNQAPPLWLVLKYIITAFDDGNESDTLDAHKNLGKGLRALQEMSMLNLTDTLPDFVKVALKDNPEELKLTFDEVTSELLSSLMQGPDDKYRFSMGFQVRPVMITCGNIPAYNLLVGIDYNLQAEIGEAGIKIDVLPSLAPQISEILPLSFEYGSQIAVSGGGFDPENTVIVLGGKELTILPGSSGDKILCTVDFTIGLDGLSAGSRSVQLVQLLPASGRHRYSNMLIGHLLPHIGAVSFVPEVTDPAAFCGTLGLTGTLLGGEQDDIFLALYREQAGRGGVVKLYTEFEEFQQPVVPVTQDTLSVHIPQSDRPPAGNYRIIIRVNGEQARQSPAIVLP